MTWWKRTENIVTPDLEIWWMTLKNNRAPLLYYIKLCASIQSYWWIQSGYTVWKRSNWVKIGNFLSHVTLIFDKWPSKSIRHLSYTMSSFVHHFKAIGEFKLELQSRTTHFQLKSAIFLSRVTFELHRWPSKTSGHLFYATSRFVHQFHSHRWI